jgi:MFS family permease
LLTSSAFSFGAVALAIFIRTWSDTLFLTRFDADEIAVFYMWSAVIFAPTTMSYAWLSQRFHPVRLNTATLLTFALLSASCLTPPTSGLWTFVILLTLSLVSPLVNAICWGLVLERLNSRQSKRLVPLIGGSATLGAAVSGALGAEVIEWGGQRALMWMIVGTLVALSPLPSVLMRGARGEANPNSEQAQKKHEPERLVDGLKALSNNSLLRVAAIATFLMAIATNLIDYLFKAKLQLDLSPDQLGPFFARFHAFTNVGILGVQVFVLSPALSRLGLRGSFGLYPLSLIALTTLCFGPVGLWAFIGLRGVDTLMKFTFYSTTENLLLTPVPFRERTQSKVFLKGAVYPMGGLVAGLLISALALRGPVHGGSEVLALTLLISLAWLWSTSRVHLHYVHQLANNLGLELGEQTLTRAERVKAREGLSALMCVPDEQEGEQEGELFELIAWSLGRPALAQPLNECWCALEKEERMDLIELIDMLCKREGLSEVGAHLEERLSTNVLC